MLFFKIKDIKSVIIFKRYILCLHLYLLIQVWTDVRAKQDPRRRICISAKIQPLVASGKCLVRFVRCSLFDMPSSINTVCLTIYY